MIHDAIWFINKSLYDINEGIEVYAWVLGFTQTYCVEESNNTKEKLATKSRAYFLFYSMLVEMYLAIFNSKI